MAETQRIDEGGLLAGFLEEFKQLETELPEVAQKLGFAGYVQYATASMFGNEQHEMLEQLTESIDAVRKQLAKRN